MSVTSDIFTMLEELQSSISKRKKVNKKQTQQPKVIGIQSPGEHNTISRAQAL